MGMNDSTMTKYICDYEPIPYDEEYEETLRKVPERFERLYTNIVNEIHKRGGCPMIETLRISILGHMLTYGGPTAGSIMVKILAEFDGSEENT